MTTLEALTIARKRGVSPSCLHVLLALIEDSPLLPSVIAARTHTTVANITGIIARMERDGWITRRHHDTDRRKILVTPSEKAYEAFTDLLESQTP